MRSNQHITPFFCTPSQELKTVFYSFAETFFLEVLIPYIAWIHLKYLFFEIWYLGKNKII